MERNTMFMDQKTLFKMSIPPTFICGFSTIPSKITAGFSYKIGKLILKFIWTAKDLDWLKQL